MTQELGESFRGHTFRHTAPRYAQIGADTLRASKEAGGRMNPRGEFGALYLAHDKKTASAELHRKAEQAGVPVRDLAPRRLLTVDVALARVLDLTAQSQQEEWGISAEELGSSHYERCQDAARAARRAGYEAILFPSATGIGNNLAVFLDRLRPGSRIEVVENEAMDLEGGSD